ncbi:hypothetical protein D9M69_522690 [compost metagenome]
MLFVPQHRHGDATGVVGGVGGVALVHEFEMVELVAGRPQVLVEGPAVFQHQPADHRNVDQVFEAFEFAQDQCAMSPRTGQGHVQVIAPGLSRETADAGRPRLAVSGQPVATLCLFALERAVLAALVPLVLPAAIH